MDRKVWYGLWLGLFILCGLLGFIPEPTGVWKVLMITVSAVFFVPGSVLLYEAATEKNLASLRLIRNISLIWLGMTLVLLVANLLSARADAATGHILYGFLVFLTAPMVCSQYWAAVLFGWACLLMVSLSLLRKVKKQ